MDIAHERLITGWPTLQEYLTERREAEQIRRRLEDKAHEWMRLGGRSGGLLDSIELLEAERWLTNPDAAELGRSGDLAVLVQASRAAIEREEQEKEVARQRELAQAQALAEEQWRRAKTERQRAEAQVKYGKTLRRRNRLIIGAGIVAIGAGFAVIILALFAVRVASLYEAWRLAATARGLLIDNPHLAVLLALASEDRASTDEAAEVISQVRKMYPRIAMTLLKHTDSVLSVAWSPDGSQLASAAADKNIILWDLTLGKPRTTLKGHTEGVLSVAWSPDGTQLASGSSDHTIILWDLTRGQPRATLKGHTGGVNSVAWHPDGTQLASAGSDTIILWDLASGRPRTTLRGHEAIVASLAWSPDGAQLASGGYDWANDIILWDLTRGQPQAILKGHTGTGILPGWRIGIVAGLAWRPDGTQLTSGASDHTIILWDLARGQPGPP